MLLAYNNASLAKLNDNLFQSDGRKRRRVCVIPAIEEATNLVGRPNRDSDPAVISRCQTNKQESFVPCKLSNLVEYVFNIEIPFEDPASINL